MASNIKFKRSSVQNRVPTTAQLELGELALNTYDGKLYTEINTGSAAVVEIGSKLSSLVVDGDNGGGNGDVTFHGATAGRDLLWDASSNSLVFADNAIAYYGSDNDLNMYHTGSHGYIKNTTGTLYIQDDTNVIIGSVTGSETGAKYIKDGALELYHNNNLRLATTDDGVDVSGTGSLKLPVGTTAQRSGSPTAGDMRYNSTTGSFEGYTNGWGELGGAGIGIGSTSVNPGSGVVGNVVGVGYTTINFVGAGLSVTGYGTTIVVDLGNAISRKYGRSIHSYTATANQTTFTGMSYTDGAAQISVYLNGAKLSAATYTATSGNTVVLGTGASVGDEVEIICIDSGVDITRSVTSYTATAGQTAFTGLGYERGENLDVYLNGIRLAQSDYTATNGTSLTLASGASVGDLLEVVDMGPGAQWESGFGEDNDDIFRFNGGVGIGTTNPTDKLNIVGNAEVIGVLTATTFKGDGSNLTGISGVTINSNADNRIITGSGTAATLNGESNLTFDGTTLAVTGAATVDNLSLNGNTVTTTSGNLTLDSAGGTTTIADNAIISGNLTVNGTQTIVNSNTVNIGDNILVLNSDETGTPSQNGGLEIERGTSTNVSLRWNETTDKWQFTNDGSSFSDIGSSPVTVDSYHNIFGGTDAGASLNSSSNNNVLFGQDAGDSITSGYENVCIGLRAGQAITDTKRNTCLGSDAGKNFNAGDSTFIGWYAGASAGSNGNVCIGHMAGSEANGGDTVVGYSCGPTASYSGTANVCYGRVAGNGLRSGASYNTIIGPGAGRNASSGQVNIEGSHNIIIGDEASLSSTTVSNECVIGAIDGQSKAITKFRIPGINFVLKDNGGTPSSGQVLTADGSGEGYWAAVGGLSNFTESENTSSPNNTVSANRFIATGSASNIDAVFQPKGTGAILAQLPDNATSGGNKRGDYAVDLQTAPRNNANQVASGEGAVIGGGQRNRVSGYPYSTVAGGQDCTITSGGNSFIGGGYLNTIGGTGACILGGTYNTCSDSHSTIIGHRAKSRWRGAIIFGANSSSAIGSNGGEQSSITHYKGQTTNATATTIGTAGTGPDTIRSITLPNNSAYGFTMTVIGAVGSGGNTSMWKFEGLIKRGANAASTAIIGNVVKNRIAYDSGASAWDVAVTANTSGSLVVTVTGQASTTIRWIANIETTELTYS